MALLLTLAVTTAATAVYLIFVVVLARRPAAGTLLLSALIAVGMNTAAALFVYPPVRRTALTFNVIEEA